MQIVITGGAGFLGVRLARTLLGLGQLARAGTAPVPITRLTLVDRVAPPEDLLNDARVAAVTGELNALLQDRGGASAVLNPHTAIVFHLAAAVSGECEADFDLGMRSNLDATRALLDACRALKSRPMLVFASSLAVFGNSLEQPLPATIEDNTLPTPQNSYGCQKFMAELLVADCTRKGFIQGRNVRLMTVSVRPGKPNGAASSFLSGMIREPLAGVRAVCPVPPETAVALSSPSRTIEGLLCAARTWDADWGARSAVNLPSIQTTAREMAIALGRVAGKAATDLIDWTPDPAIDRIVTNWPARIRATRAAQLGLLADTDFEAIIRDYVSENPNAVKLPVSA
jgi:nucleoside-diphosphate-sugar epimerase